MIRVLRRRDEEAVASSIGTMLAILVVLALLTMLTTSWAPEWSKGKESEHMRVVESQFASLKALMDQLSLSGQTETVVSTPITLGSEGVPLFSSDASGTISLLSSHDDGYNTFSVTNSTGKFQRTAYGSIMFESHNNEYVNMDFLYESGALIVSQNDGQLMTTGPSLIIQNLSGKMNVAVTMLSIYSDGNAYTGKGTIGIQARLVKEKITTSHTWEALETVYLNVTSSAYEAWYDYFLRTIPEGGVGTGDFDITVDGATSSISVELRNVRSVSSDYVILGASLDL